MDTVIAAPSAAADAVAAYLRRFGLTDPDRLDGLVARFVAEAGSDAGSAPERAERAVAAWFARILDGALSRPELAEPIGRAAFLLADGPRRWAEAFLADDPPAAMVAALRRAAPVPAPEPLPAAMVAQTLELPRLLSSLRRPAARVERSSP